LYVGPHIGPCCYETSAQILERFTQAFGQVCDAGQRHLDLAAAVQASLLQAGASPQRIVHAGRCTSCNNSAFFSYRADGGTTGRHGAFAYLTKE
ncbi:MAG: polyphenol oxidase family protein, partial [Coriobacteriales bacterium]|nr:polyphenol oxidase family protein [Coriobacteriales bacterium]